MRSAAKIIRSMETVANGGKNNHNTVMANIPKHTAYHVAFLRTGNVKMASPLFLVE